VSTLGDIFDYQKFLGGDVWKKWKDNPERALLGINTPFESKVWGGILGKNYEPTVDMFGGNTEAQSRAAGAQGINAKPGEKMHDIARAITSLFAGGYGVGKLGGLGGLGGSAGTTAPAWGSLDAGPGAYSASGASASSPSWLKYARLANMAMNMGGGGGGQTQQYGPPQHQFVGPETQNPYAMMLRRMYGR